MNASVTNCGSLNKVEICYEWWTENTKNNRCYINVSNGTDIYNVVNVCPGISPGASGCVDVTSALTWTCGNFFNTTGTRAYALSEVEGTGPQAEAFWDVFYFNVTYDIADNIDPVVNLNSPEDYYNSSSSTINFNCSAYDNYNLTNITLYGNWTIAGWHANETNTSGINDTDYIFSKTITPDGSYIWNCLACDSFGNCAFNDSNRTFTIDATYPQITINSPTNDTYTNAAILVNITATDTNLDTTWYNWNGTNVTYTTEINVTFAEGSNTLWVYANDTFGNENQTSVTFNVDSVYPQITINSPTNDTYNTDLILVDVTATDDNLDTIWYNWNGTNVTYTSAINVTFAEGVNTLYAYANDTFGNENSTSVTFAIDTSAPNITGITTTPTLPFYNMNT